MKSTASRSTTPDNLYGWGILNALKALQPAAPQLAAPPAGATGTPDALTLTWAAGRWTDGYRIQLASDSLFAAPIVNDSLTGDTLRAVSGLAPATRHFWRVRGGNLYGPGSWSEVRSFTTAALPPAAAPVPVSPPPGATGVPVAPACRWTSVAGASLYRLQVSADSGFTTLLLEDSTLTDTSRTLPALLHAATYHWRVRGENGAGAGPFAPHASFTTVIAPPALAPVLLEPAPGATGLGTQVVFRWSAAPDASSYIFLLARDSSLTQLVHVDSLLTDTLTTVPGLMPGRTYFWSVRGENAGGPGPLASSSGFVVDPALTQPLPVQAGWNLLALPFGAADPRTVTIFPQATTQAFGFLASSGYHTVDSLFPGRGYWLKFDLPDTVLLAGEVLLADTIPVTAGWNIIGGLSVPVDTGSVTAQPPGARASAFFAFGAAGYAPATVLSPGAGYWVKADADGLLILQAPLPAARRRPGR
jgi:hypothetical protein